MPHFPPKKDTMLPWPSRNCSVICFCIRYNKAPVLYPLQQALMSCEKSSSRSFVVDLRIAERFCGSENRNAASTSVSAGVVLSILGTITQLYSLISKDKISVLNKRRTLIQISVMLAALTAVVAVAHLVTAAEFPNGTSNKLNFFSCNPLDAIDVSSIELFDHDGAPMYPIRLQDLAAVKLKSYNKGDVVAKDKVDVMVYAYVEKNGKWNWKSIIPKPFQFLLNNIDGCKMAHNCPLTAGDLNLTISLDLSKYSVLFKFIDKTVAHQFVIKMYNAKGHGEISCVTVQFKLA